MNKFIKHIKDDFSNDSYLKGLFLGICLTGLVTYVSIKKTKSKTLMNDLGGIYQHRHQDQSLKNYVNNKTQHSLWNMFITYEENGVLVKKILSHKTALGDLVFGLMLTGIWPISWRALNFLSGAAAISVVVVLNNARNFT